MTYDYFCTSCESRWEENLLIANRDKPLSDPCPHCSEHTVKRGFIAAPGINSMGCKTILQRAGSGWNDVLNKVKKASGKENTIQTR